MLRLPRPPHSHPQTGSLPPLLLRAARNIAGVKVAVPGSLNLYDIIYHRNLLMTREALSKIEEIWGK